MPQLDLFIWFLNMDILFGFLIIFLIYIYIQIFRVFEELFIKKYYVNKNKQIQEYLLMFKFLKIYIKYNIKILLKNDFYKNLNKKFCYFLFDYNNSLLDQLKKFINYFNFLYFDLFIYLNEQKKYLKK